MNTNEIVLLPEFAQKVADLYAAMEEAYDRTAEDLDFSCSGCPDNCCDSYFQHHTYTEWAYLWEGLNELAADRLESILAKAGEYVSLSETSLAQGERPMRMCPLNEAGMCTLYLYRMMICRLHGVPATFTRPDGQQIHSPGCFRYQENIAAKNFPTPLDRSQFFQRLVNLELELLGNKRPTAPRVKLTIAQMIVKGPPKLT